MKELHTLKKDDLLTLQIEDMGIDGAGIGKANGIPLFVKDAVIGDIVTAKIMKMKKQYGYARMMEIVTPSEYRVSPRCSCHRQCGGCQLQSLSYAKQLEFKTNKVKNNLQHIGGFSEVEQLMEPILGMEDPFEYRNKSQFPVGRDREGRLAAGFYASRSHTMIPNRRCALAAPVTERILDTVLLFMEKNQIEPYDETTGKGLIRHVLIRTGHVSGEVLVCLVINGTKLPCSEKLVEDLCRIEGMASISLNINQKKTNVILGETLILLWGREYLTDSIGPIQYQISPLSFYQVNPIQTERLYQITLEFAQLTGTETVWDLYCGIGTISLFLAQRAKMVYGVEVVPQAIENARTNAQRNGIKNVTFFDGKAEEVLPRFYEEAVNGSDDAGMSRPDVIVVDPPRKGCDVRCLDTIVQMQPQRVVYVSCDSATLARDLKYLCQQGYLLKKVQPVDMFPQTVGIETIVLLSHKSPDSVINVTVEFGDGEGKVPLDKIAERAKRYQPKPKITYKMIQEYVEKKYGFKVHTAYIAEVKRSLRLTMYDASNAVEELKHPRKRPPKEKVEAIMDALKYFEVI